MSQPKSDTNVADQAEFPPAPAWAVGADAAHTGPSGMGPGTDRPGFGQEIDEDDAAGVIGGAMADGSEPKAA
jgi:hypothetical protein